MGTTTEKMLAPNEAGEITDERMKRDITAEELDMVEQGAQAAFMQAERERNAAAAAEDVKKTEGIAEKHARLAEEGATEQKLANPEETLIGHEGAELAAKQVKEEQKKKKGFFGRLFGGE